MNGDGGADRAVELRVFDSRSLAEADLGWRARRAAVEEGRLRRLRRGYYTDTPLDPNDRAHHLLERSVATAGCLAPGTVLSHESALAVHGLPLVALKADRVVITRHRAGSGSRSGRLVRCHNVPVEGAVTEVGGVPVTTVARSLVDVARAGRAITALCAADTALASAACTEQDLRDELRAGAGRRGIARARELLPRANGLAESPLESLSRFRILEAGLPEPELQVVFPLPGGRRARADLYWWDHRLVGECDGLGQYGIDVRDVTGSLRREKHRENALAMQGIRVVRWTWEDAWDGAPMLDALRAAFRLQELAGFGAGAVS